VVVCVVAAIGKMARNRIEIGIVHAEGQAARVIATIMRWQCNN
jgi:hypothetical protein